MIKCIGILFCSFLFSGLGVGQKVLIDKNSGASDNPSYNYVHPIKYSPKQYVCYKTNKEIIVDGELSKIEWGEIPWTDLFVDIEGDLKNRPNLNTKAKMTWDESYFYVAAKIEEPHIWATLTKRDAIMFQDDDFEVFIEPDGDGHNYFEFEMNAFNTIWDLYMLYPYYIDDERNYIMNWDIRGIKSAVHLGGTINDPSDLDDFWSVEIAIPWKAFEDFKKGSGRPNDGEQWRVNFSRVDWTMDIVSSKYKKRKNKSTGKNLAENNWVWSPTGFINMHKPEVWGYVQFESDNNKSFNEDLNEHIKWGLWQVYYQIKDCRKRGSESCDLEDMTIPNIHIEEYSFEPTLQISDFSFSISASSLSNNNIFVISEKGRMSIVEK